MNVGWFATSGERHLWMYDERNLHEALRKAGFTAPTRQSAGSSSWDGWADQNLDIEDDGRPYKPESLYMEAVKP
jgi:hypothetical protein